MVSPNEGIRPLSSELAKKAKTELNESPSKLENGVQHLKEWIKKQPHLRARTDDQWLAAFLRGCKHSLERAKDKIDLYYSLRSISPDLFAFRPNDPSFQELIKTGAVLVLPKLSKPVAPRVVIIRPGMYDPTKFSATDFFSMSHILQQITYLEDDAFMVNGTINIMDLQGITMAHFLQMSPTLLKKVVIAGQDASPLRLKSLHHINTLPIFEKFFNIAVKFINAKHKKRIFVHSTKDSVIEKYVSKDILPLEYGGKGGSSQEIIDYWLKKVDEYRQWLDEDIKYGTDESLRPGKPKTAEIMFGVEGSFRRLEFD